MPVRAKFKCTISEAVDDTGRVVMAAVYDPNPESENGKFFRYTPSGSLELAVVNPAVMEQLEAGREYYIDISPAE